jgi:hypothetical protein
MDVVALWTADEHSISCKGEIKSQIEKIFNYLSKGSAEKFAFRSRIRSSLAIRDLVGNKIDTIVFYDISATSSCPKFSKMLLRQAGYCFRNDTI